jgi:hypothetical protein
MSHPLPLVLAGASLSAKQSTRFDQSLTQFPGRFQSLRVVKDFIFAVSSPVDPPVGRDHFVLEEEGMNCRNGAFRTVSPAYDYGATYLIPQLSFEAPRAIHEGLELG